MYSKNLLLLGIFNFYQTVSCLGTGFGTSLDFGHPEIEDTNQSQKYYIGEFADKKYYVGRLNLTWAEASEYCKSESMESAAIESLDERNYLSRVVPAKHYYWTSGVDKGSPDQFIWTTGNTPITIPIESVFPRNTALCYFSSRNELSSRLSNFQYYPLCQSTMNHDGHHNISKSRVEAVEEITESKDTHLARAVENQPAPMLTYIGQYRDKLYYEEQTEVSWNRANLSCQDSGMGLVAVESNEERNFLWSAVRSELTYWTSGVDKGSAEQFVWDTGNKSITVPIDGEIYRNTGIDYNAYSNKLEIKMTFFTSYILCQRQVQTDKSNQ